MSFFFFFCQNSKNRFDKIFNTLQKRLLVYFRSKFTTDCYLQIDRTLQLYTNTFTFNTTNFTCIKVIKNTFTDTKLFKAH